MREWRVRVLTFVPTVVSADYDFVALCAHYLILMTGSVRAYRLRLVVVTVKLYSRRASGYQLRLLFLVKKKRTKVIGPWA